MNLIFFNTSGWVEGNQTHTPEHACQKSINLHHQSPQKQRVLLFGKGIVQPSLHYLQICKIKRHNVKQC